MSTYSAVDVTLAHPEYYHVIERAYLNLTIDNPTPDIRSRRRYVPLDGGERTDELGATLYMLPIILNFQAPSLEERSDGQNLVPLYLRVKAPTIYQAEETNWQRSMSVQFVQECDR